MRAYEAARWVARGGEVQDGPLRDAGDQALEVGMTSADETTINSPTWEGFSRSLARI